MSAISSQHKILVNHPVFLSISIISYGAETTPHNLIGSGKVYLNFLYGNFKKINTDGTEPDMVKCHLQPVENHFSFQTSNGAKLITLGLKPYYWHSITSNWAKKSYNTHFNLENCISQAYVQSLYKALSDLDCPESALQQIDKYLCLYYPRWSKLTPIQDLVEEIYRTQANITIREILRKFQIPRSTLNAYFDKYIGVSPKFYIKLIRFNYLLREFLLENKSKSEIISSWDYYDYSHFKKDFIQFTGVLPKNFKKNKNGNLHQDFENYSYL